MKNAKDYRPLMLVVFTIISLVFFLVLVLAVHESSHAYVCMAFGGNTTITLDFNERSYAGCNGGVWNVPRLFLMVLMPYLVDTLVFAPVFLGLWIRPLNGKSSTRSIPLYSVLIAVLLAVLIDTTLNYLSFDFKDNDILRAVWLSNAAELPVMDAWSLKVLIAIPIVVIWSGTATLLIKKGKEPIRRLTSQQTRLIDE